MYFSVALELWIQHAADLAAHSLLSTHPQLHSFADNLDGCSTDCIQKTLVVLKYRHKVQTVSSQSSCLRLFEIQYWP